MWHPRLLSALVLYRDELYFEWNIGDGTLKSISDNRTSCMDVGNSSLFTISRLSMTMNVWSVPGYHHISQIPSVGGVSALAVNSNESRFYTLSDTTLSDMGALPVCSVWQPGALLRLRQNTDREQLSYATEDPQLMSEGRDGRIQFRSFWSDPEGRFYGWENYTREVFMCDMSNGQQVHLLGLGISDDSFPSRLVAMAWSQSGRYVTFAHKSGHVTVGVIRKLKLDDGDVKLGVGLVIRLEPVARVPFYSFQVLFDISEKYLLVAFESRGGMSNWRVWNLNNAEVVCTSQCRPEFEGARWLQHPTDSTLLLLVDEPGIRAFMWDSLAEVDLTSAGVVQEARGVRDTHPLAGVADSSIEVSPAHGMRRIKWINRLVANERHVVFDGDCIFGPDDSAATRQIMVIDIGASTGPTKPKPVDGMSERVKMLLGCFQDHVVFLDHDYCVCTWDLRVGVSSLQQHFYLPKDWLDPMWVWRCVVNKQGTVLCPRNGEVGIIRGGIQL